MATVRATRQIWERWVMMVVMEEYSLENLLLPSTVTSPTVAP